TDVAGLQAVDGSVISAELGIQSRSLRALLLGGHFSLTNAGREIPWTSDGVKLFFHAEAIDSLFTTKNVYWLSFAKGQTMAATSVGAPSGAAVPAFADTLHLETDSLPATVLPLDPASDYWFWDFFLAGDPTFGKKTYDVTVPATAAGAASLDVLLHGATTAGRTGEHAVRVALNGVTLGDVVFEGIAPKRGTFALPSGALLAGNNRLELTSLVTPQGTPSAVLYLDSFDLTYPRTFDAGGAPQLAFWVDPASSQSVSVTGLAGGSVSLYDITNPAAPRRVTGATPLASGVSFSAAVPSRTRFLAVATPAVPGSMRARCDLGLATRDLSADYVAVTSDALRKPLSELMSHRASQGLDPLLVTFEDVADAFSFGLPDPASLRSFVSRARSSWHRKPRFVLLAGAGNYDYRNLKGFGANHVPPLMTGTPNGLFPADHLIVETGDGLTPRTSIGRLPARDEDELAAAIGKILAYESPSTLTTRQSAYILADNPDSGYDFGADASKLAAVIPPSIVPTTSALGPAPLATVRSNLFARLAAGLGLLGYLGHGGLDRLAQEGILTSADVPTLPNASVSPVLTAYTCTINRFGIPGFASLGERLVNRTSGGASAVVAPAGLSDHPEARMLGTILTRSVFSVPGTPLGDVVEGATDQFLEDGGSAELLRLLTIFGDPAMRLTPAAAPPSSGSSGE
ncbi:MAG: hypothetical protein JNK60_19940, partial [Acidobacteria bacterium]|nr:hypothetical protein [Acidobacteriota bacterium]